MLIKFLAQLFQTSGARQPSRADAATLRERFEALLQADDCEAALALAERAAARDPASYEAQLLLGRAHQKLHAPEPALACFEAARRMRDDDAELYDFRGALYQELGRLPEAFADYERALALRPDFPLAAFHLAMARLLSGDFARGWEGYELRRLIADPIPGTAGLARWEGEPLAGRTLFLAREQGVGDEFMYASMLPQLIAQAGHCLIECDPRVEALLQRSFPSATLFASPPGGGLPPAIVPRPDLVTEAGSVARFLRRGAGDFPRHEGYLRADPAQVARWRERLTGLGPGLKVALSWTGGVRKTRRTLRSIPLDALLPVLRVPGVRFVSLQYTPEARAELDVLEARHGIRVEHWPEVIKDLDQTAALLCALDLTVSVCTSLVHLCGALGRPVWVMTPLGPEWRYGVAGDSMPWYPSVRLFRQAEYRRWEPVVAAVAAALQARAATGGGS